VRSTVPVGGGRSPSSLDDCTDDVETGRIILLTVPACASYLNFGIPRFMKSYRNALLSAVVAMLVLFTAGCHTVTPATVVDRQKLTGKKQIYVVQSTGKDRGFRKEIERNLAGRGFIITSGPMERLGEQSELYLVYEDRWSWDMVMYPSRVKIAIYDTKTHALLGSDEFKNSAFHTFADPPEITDELLGRIFGEPEGRYMK
jgi:hypothetical protein